MQKGFKKVLSLTLSILLLLPCIATGFSVSAADVDFTALNEVIAQAEAVNADDYVDLTALNSAVDKAKNADIQTQTEADDLAAGISLETLRLEKKFERKTTTLTMYRKKRRVNHFDCWARLTVSNIHASSGDVSSIEDNITWNVPAYWATATAYVYTDLAKVNTLADLNIGAHVNYEWLRSNWYNSYVFFDGKTLFSLSGNKDTFGQQRDLGTFTLDTSLPAKGSTKNVLFRENFTIDVDPVTAIQRHDVNFVINSYDTSALREAIALPAPTKSNCSAQAYGAYITALKNASEVLNTPVTVKTAEGDTANYENIAAAQGALDKAEAELRYAYAKLTRGGSLDMTVLDNAVNIAEEALEQGLNKYVSLDGVKDALTKANAKTFNSQTDVTDAAANIILEIYKLENAPAAKKSYRMTREVSRSGHFFNNGYIDINNVDGDSGDSYFSQTYNYCTPEVILTSTAYAYADLAKASTLADLGITIKIWYSWFQGQRGHKYAIFNGKQLYDTNISQALFGYQHDGGTWLLDADLPEKASSAKYGYTEGLLNYHCNTWNSSEFRVTFTINSYDTTELRNAIALPVEDESHYSKVSYSVYLSALENAVSVLNTPVTTVELDGEGANYENIAAAQEAIDTATERLVNAYNALDKDFVIEYYSDEVLVDSQTILYADSYNTKLLSEVPEKAGYTLSGWIDSANNVYTLDSFTSAAAPTHGGTVRLDAQFDTNEYTVTFVNYNGDVLYSTTVKYNECAEYAGEEPIKPDEGETGYMFAGWDKDIDAPITENTVFTAQFDSHTHSYSELLEVIKEANCSETGESLYMCACGRTKDVETPIDPDNHDLIHHEAKTATCTESGWYEYDTCSRCDYTTFVEIGTIAHTPGTAVIENKIDADCVNAGSYDEVFYCTECGNEISREHKTIDALGHNFVLAEHKDSTCAQKGYDLYKCSRCDDQKKTELALKAHTWDNGVVTKEPAADNPGEKTYTCKVCKATKAVKLYVCSHCDEIFEGGDAYNEHKAEHDKTCPYCGYDHDGYLEHMTFVKLRCFLTRLFKLLFGFFGSFK